MGDDTNRVGIGRLWWGALIAGAVGGIAASALILLLTRAPILTFFAQKKDAFQGLQALATVVGLFVASVWFLRRRELFPKANLSLHITHRVLSGGTVWLHVNATIENKGQV
ncbi:MAG TPA: hypothetical protein VEQ60_26750, partial [Longimicrobium sp.]|nr:hypothetical protein [Longimicrobium sp.]